MKNYVKPGDMVTFTASGATPSGSVVTRNALVGISAGTYADGDEGEMKTTGVFNLPRAGGQAWQVGAKVYWTGSEATTTASGNTRLGVAASPAASGANVGDVRLDGTSV